MSQQIALTVNGEPRRTAPGNSVADLVAEIGLNPKKVAVERNGEIVPRGTHGDVVLADGDVLEIVHFVGGG
ncbi:thiamine biosynthesis protein ThiS [Novosphingobium sp. TH158]|nr:thiamine biosynthesis protein ThiS [Novosphingobium sp. TH158]